MNQPPRICQAWANLGLDFPSLGTCFALGALGFSVLVHFHNPVVGDHALLWLSLVAPSLLPLARVLVELLALHPPLLSGLGLDALLGGEPLPLGRLLGGREGLLTGQRGGGSGQVEQDAGLGGLQRQRGQELVDERLRAVAGGLGQAVLERHGGVGGRQRVWVGGQEQTEIECVGCRLGDLHLELGCGRHYVDVTAQCDADNLC
jgi:hypothetical protein